MKHEKSCGAVIIHNGAVLLEHQTNDHWSFPKGHVEPGETELETAIREVKEETGLDVTIDPSVRYSFSYHIADRNVDKEVVLFFGQLTQPEQSLTAQASEIAEIRWVPFAEVDSTFQRPDWQKAWQYFYAKLSSNQ